MARWAEVSIHTTHEAAEAVANILHEAGASGVVIEDAEDLHRHAYQKHSEGEAYLVELNPDDYPDEGVVLKAYFPMNSFLGETVENIRERVNNLLIYDIHLGKGTISFTEVHEEDWAHAWKKFYKPVRISSKVTIAPTWEMYQPESNEEVVIQLDPGMAFGTGTHPTTVLSMQALEKYIRPGDRVIDVGSGSGVLSIAAAKLGAGDVLAVDIDELAVKVTRENAKLNSLAHKIRVERNNLLDHIDEKVDLIVANILAEVILRFVHQAYERLVEGGYFITSGIISPKKEEVEHALISQGFTMVETVCQEDWVALIAKKE